MDGAFVYDNPIAFPGLGLEFNPSPVIFGQPIFGRYFYWYGLIIALGFLLAAFYAVKKAPRFGIKGDDLIDVLIFALPAAIVGARLYFVIFNFAQFREDPMRILRVWEGGLAIYGGIIGAVIAAFFVCRFKKMNFFAVLDLGALGLLIGQCIGRWGNFINREAHGTLTNLPWRMEIYVAEYGGRVSVHPTFLYESLLTLMGFVLLHIYTKRRKFNGEIFLLYVAWYGLGRGLIEGLRTDSLFIPGTNIRVSQLLGFASCIAALVLLFFQRVFREHDPDEIVDLTLQPEGAAAVQETSVTGDENVDELPFATVEDDGSEEEQAEEPQDGSEEDQTDADGGEDQ